MDLFSNFFSHFVQPDVKTALLVVVNLIVIESLLSVDNAAVLATLVMPLPQTQRKRALRIGIPLAYVFRGSSLVFASVLIKVEWLRLIGGGYLLYLCAEFFVNKWMSRELSDNKSGTKKSLRKLPLLNYFWSTIVIVELMDLTFSIDNVFAAVTFTKNIYLICTGVFIGIISMRIAAGYFVKLMETFPFLDTVAFLIIGILGVRLCSDFLCNYLPGNATCDLLHNDKADYYFSTLTAGIFFLPIIVSVIYNSLTRKRN